MMMLIFWWSIHVWLSWAMCLDTFSSIPSKDSPIVPKQWGWCQDYGQSLVYKKKKGKKEKETETGALCFREEMYQKAFCPSPPRTTTSARLAAKSTNYWLVVGENGAWQQLPRWPGLCVNTKIPLLLLILLPPYFLTPPPPQCSVSPTEEEDRSKKQTEDVCACV